MNGLTLNKNEFMKLPVKEQLAVLYENQQKTIYLIEGYKFHYKLTNWMLGILTTGMGILFSFQIFK